MNGHFNSHDKGRRNKINSVWVLNAHPLCIHILKQDSIIFLNLVLTESIAFDYMFTPQTHGIFNPTNIPPFKYYIDSFC